MGTKIIKEDLLKSYIEISNNLNKPFSSVIIKLCQEQNTNYYETKKIILESLKNN